MSDARKVSLIALALAGYLSASVGAKAEDCPVCEALTAFGKDAPTEELETVLKSVDKGPFAPPEANPAAACSNASLLADPGDLRAMSDRAFLRAERLAVSIETCGGTCAPVLNEAERCGAQMGLDARAAAFARAASALGQASVLAEEAVARAVPFEAALAERYSLYAGGVLRLLERAMASVSGGSGASVADPEWKASAEDLSDLAALVETLDGLEVLEGAEPLGDSMIDIAERLPILGGDIEAALSTPAELQPSQQGMLRVRLLETARDVLTLEERLTKMAEAARMASADVSTDANALSSEDGATVLRDSAKCMDDLALDLGVAATAEELAIELLESCGARPTCNQSMPPRLSLPALVDAEGKADKEIASLAQALCVR